LPAHVGASERSPGRCPISRSGKIVDVKRVVQTGRYPNPSAAKRWIDHLGREWSLRGERGQPLDGKRARHLLRKSGIPLAMWSVGEISWFEDIIEKQAAADHLHQRAQCAEDVFVSEWRRDHGEQL
jgi:hypothetical protein